MNNMKKCNFGEVVLEKFTIQHNTNLFNFTMYIWRGTNIYIEKHTLNLYKDEEHFIVFTKMQFKMLTKYFHISKHSEYEMMISIMII